MTKKNIPGHSDESTIASITVNIKTMTSIKILQTIRVVKLPLETEYIHYNHKLDDCPVLPGIYLTRTYSHTILLIMSGLLQ